MKSKKILLSLLCVGAALGTTSCKVKTGTPTPTEPETPITEPATTPEKTETPTVSQVTYNATLVYNNGAENGSLTSVEDGGKYFFDKPTDPVKQYHKFLGWYTDEALTQPFNFNSEVSSDITLYAKFEPAYDTVNTVWNFQESANTIDPSVGSGKLTLEQKTYTFQNKFIVESEKAYFQDGYLNTQGCDVKFILSGAGTTNSFTLNATYSSSDKGTVVIKNAETNEEIFKVEAQNKDVIEVNKINLSAGTYVISSKKANGDGASLKINALSVGEQLPQGPTSGISVSASGATTDFLKGREFSSAGLSVVLEYANGRQDPLTTDQYKISAVDTTTAGKKTVTITYQVNATTTYTDEYEIIVWEAQSLNVYNYIYKDKTTKHARYVYFADETEKSVENITVKALCSAPQVEGTKEFILASNEYTVNKENTNKIEFTYGDLDAAFDHVTVNKVDLSAAKEITVTVDPSSPVTTANGYNFHTIMQAMQFLSLAKASEDAIKTIELKADTIYKEKVEITLPNVVLTTKYTDQPSIEHAATIEYGVMAGDMEPGESGIYVTDGSATVSIRKEAEGFKAEYVKFVHSCNTVEEYNIVKEKMKDTQGVAVLVQADKSQFLNCYFSGYQDTLEAQIGRQYYENCYIEGRTDYIFGHDATAYFNGCTIYTINGGENQHNGGYVVATKGNTKTPIEFGYVFDNCKFDADEKVLAGSVSLARGWDKDMTMAVINSNISAHYSKEAYGEVTADNPDTEIVEPNYNDRYGKMNAAPVASKLVEYNNTGDGAITASIKDTCTVLTAEQAEKYVPANIFTANNGGTTYESSWNPLAKDFAKLIIKDAEETTLLTVDEFAELGTVATAADYETIVAQLTAPTGKEFGGLYVDKDFSTEFDISAELIAENIIYVKWNALAATKTFSGTFTKEDGSAAVYKVDGFTFNFSGSNNIGYEIGDKTSVANAKCPKFSTGNAVTSKDFDNATNKVKIEIIGATSKSDKAVDVTVEALDAEGNVVTTITMKTTLNKTTGYFTYNDDEFGTLTSETNNISSVRVSYTGEDEKHFSVRTIIITYDVVQ